MPILQACDNIPKKRIEHARQHKGQERRSLPVDIARKRVELRAKVRGEVRHVVTCLSVVGVCYESTAMWLHYVITIISYIAFTMSLLIATTDRYHHTIAYQSTPAP